MYPKDPQRVSDPLCGGTVAPYLAGGSRSLPHSQRPAAYDPYFGVHRATADARAARVRTQLDPPPQALRAFEEDYPLARWPAGPPVDATGRLTHDIDGVASTPYRPFVCLPSRHQPLRVPSASAGLAGSEVMFLTTALLENQIRTSASARGSSRGRRGGRTSCRLRAMYRRASCKWRCRVPWACSAARRHAVSPST
jgi:hypothetical protein